MQEPDEALKQRVDDLYWQIDSLLKDKMSLYPEDLQELSWTHGFLFAITLVFDKYPDEQVPLVIGHIEKQLKEFLEMLAKYGAVPQG